MTQLHRATVAPQVLVLMGAYWPGHDATGPNQSLRGLMTAVAEARFAVVARDRPFGGATALAATGRWHDGPLARHRYCAVRGALGAQGLRQLLSGTHYDVLMLNGFFDREFTLPALTLRRLGLIPRKPTILSVRGELASGALALKPRRKRAALALARHGALHRDVWLHATGPLEERDIMKAGTGAKGVLVAPNVRLIEPLPTRQPAEPGAPLKLAFIGRIARVKNLDYALRALARVGAPVAYDLFGPIQEADYWEHCRRLIAALPGHVKVTHKGEVANASMVATVAGYDLLLLPTKGENFGHAILDALEAGVPALISDQTPFRGLEAQRAGLDLPLAQPERFSAAIERFASLAPAERNEWRQAARSLAERTVAENDAAARSRDMLSTVMRADNARGES